MILFEMVVLLLAGIGAGIVTGLMGASAVTIAAPIMIIFLGYDAFIAIGISLAIDVFASAVTASVFYKHKRINIKPSILILIFSVIGAFVGSYFSSYFSAGLLSKLVGFFVMFSGINLMRKGIRGEVRFFKDRFKNCTKKSRFLILSLAGLFVGLIAGIAGAGGGVTLLIILTFFLGYGIHTAIGTSVFIMMFIALSGSIGHIMYGSFRWYSFVVASVGGIIGAYYTAKKANGLPEEKLNKIVGFVFFVLGLFLLFKELVFLIY
ncbi:MAG: sulfite exporter TauE/SafE family protein [Nanoarchaeota archaeon]|nr:sulfite exporter TauE/SafE family protein [Nanoarchaeota archaeon]